MARIVGLQLPHPRRNLRYAKVETSGSGCRCFMPNLFDCLPHHLSIDRFVERGQERRPIAFQRRGSGLVVLGIDPRLNVVFTKVRQMHTA